MQQGLVTRRGTRARTDKLGGYDFTRRQFPVRHPDIGYEPQQAMNVGFLDGHVERLNYWQMMTLDGDRPPTPNQAIWFGGQRGGEASFD